MEPVCVAGAADMNRAAKCITVINANKMKGSYQRRQTDMNTKGEGFLWLQSMRVEAYMHVLPPRTTTRQ